MCKHEFSATPQHKVTRANIKQKAAAVALLTASRGTQDEAETTAAHDSLAMQDDKADRQLSNSDQHMHSLARIQ
jgi:hypothetical protein